MDLAEDLRRSSELFDVSLRLQSVANGLGRMIDGLNIQGHGDENFGWGAYLLGQMDTSSEHYARREHLGMLVLETSLKPYFYKALQNARVEFNSELSKKVYETLQFPDRNSLNMEELQKVKQIFELMGRYVLNELQSVHGLPDED